MKLLRLVLVLWSGAAAAENLLANPGFEEVDAFGSPVHWDVFVMPEEGLEGRVDMRVAYEGQNAVVLHNGRLSTRDTVNNWSQNIITEAGGKEFLVSGYIKTRDATEAALWLQCWRKQPARLLHAVTSSAESPMDGTKDWTYVEMRAKAPMGTDFLTFRCVLRGTGTAWFDDVRVDDEPREAEDEQGGEHDGEDEKPPEATVAGAASLRTLLDANEAMRETITALRDTNAVLAEEIAQLHAELRQLRRELAEVRDARDVEEAPLTPAPQAGAPPLVPRVTGAGRDY